MDVGDFPRLGEVVELEAGWKRERFQEEFSHRFERVHDHHREGYDYDQSVDRQENVG
jgi:hypothetical protein